MSTADFPVSVTGGANFDTDAIRLTDGRFVVAFSKQPASNSDAFYRLYDATGNALTGEVMLHPASSTHEVNPTLAALADGGFLATWILFNAQNSTVNIQAQRFDSEGNTIGALFNVSRENANQQNVPAATGLADGGYLVGWAAPDGSSNGAFFQRFDVFGAKVGGAVQINATSGGNQSAPDVAGLANGGWVAAYTDETAIRYKVYNASGAVTVSDTRVDNLASGGAKNEPKIAVLEDGDFVITWYNSDNGGIFARQFAASGAPQGDEFRVNPLPDYFNGLAEVTALDDGGYVISWWNLSTASTFFQRFNADGAAIGSVGAALANDNVGNLKELAAIGLDGGGWAFFGSAVSGSNAFSIFGAIHGQASALNDYETMSAPGTFDALAGNDFVLGSGGADLIFGRTGRDTLNGQGGSDTLVGGLGNDWLLGGEGNDSLAGNAGDDRLEGGNGNDTLRGGDGTDAIDGGAGVDLATGGAGDDTILGAAGNDILKGGEGDDIIDGGEDNDRIVGAAGDDWLTGGTGNDTIFGGDGDDVIDAGGGADRINAGLGDDVITAGFGADVIVFRDRNFGEDIVLDFQDGVDKLNVKGLISSFAAVTVEGNGSDAILSFARGEVILRGMAGLVDASDFIF